VRVLVGGAGRRRGLFGRVVAWGWCSNRLRRGTRRPACAMVWPSPALRPAPQGRVPDRGVVHANRRHAAQPAPATTLASPSRECAVCACCVASWWRARLLQAGSMRP
jgi:hypothetical protein